MRGEEDVGVTVTVRKPRATSLPPAGGQRCFVVSFKCRPPAQLIASNFDLFFPFVCHVLQNLQMCTLCSAFCSTSAAFFHWQDTGICCAQ